MAATPLSAADRGIWLARPRRALDAGPRSTQSVGVCVRIRLSAPCYLIQNTRSKSRVPRYISDFGLWLSLVERLVRDQEAVGSNPTSPILITECKRMFYCSVLRSEKTGRRYVGSCEDLADRIRRHNAGESKATKQGLPWALIQSEAFATRAEAAQRERHYKTGRGRDELDKFR